MYRGTYLQGRNTDEDVENAHGYRAGRGGWDR